MQPKTRHILITCFVLVLLSCCGLAVLGIIGTGAGIWASSQPTPTTRVVTQRPTLAATPTLNGGTPHPTPAGAEVPYADRVQMDEIQSQVIEERGLQPLYAVDRALLTADELKQKVTDDFFKNYTQADAQDDVLVLSLFGLLYPETDLIQLYKDLYSEQVAGFYDPEVKQMYVIQDTGFNGVERMTYAHEYTHVLQDQNYDLQNGLRINDKDCLEETERCAAVQALTEGDASMVEQIWFSKYATSKDQADVQQFYQNYSSPVYDSLPAFLHEDFTFPYVQGLEFVQTLYDQGGWQAVDAAYTNPPLSTEQILHPEKYPSDKPIKVTLPDLLPTLGADWELVDSADMGEWYTYLILAFGRDEADRLPEDTARDAAAGWGGDRYAIYRNASTHQSMLVLSTTWDSETDAEEFASAFGTYGTERWGKQTASTNHHWTWQDSAGQVEFIQQGKQTLWLIAPEDVVQPLLSLLEP